MRGANRAAGSEMGRRWGMERKEERLEGAWAGW